MSETSPSLGERAAAGAPPARLVPATLAALLAGSAEFLLGGAALGRFGIAGALGVHALASAGLVLWAALRTRAGRAGPGDWLAAIATTFLGPFGAASAAASLALLALLRRRSTPFEEWYAALFPREDRGRADELYERLRAGRERTGGGEAVVPFVDVLSRGAAEQKGRAIALLARRFQPAFAPALMLARADADPSIRVQAATAMAYVENKYVGRWMRLRRAAADAPEDPRAQRELARHLDDYAESGLLDPDRVKEVRREAARAYRACLALDPSDRDAHLGLGRLMLRRGSFDAAAEVASFLARTADGSAEAFAYYLECLYRLERYEEIREAMRRRADALEDLPRVLASAGALWRRGAAAPAGEAA